MIEAVQYVWDLTKRSLLNKINSTTIQGMEIADIIAKYNSKVRFRTVSSLIRYLHIGSRIGTASSNDNIMGEHMLDCMTLIRNVFIRSTFLGRSVFGSGMDAKKAWKLEKHLDVLERNRFMTKDLFRYIFKTGIYKFL